MRLIVYLSLFSMLVCCYWCILILIIILVVRWCFLIGPHKLAVVLFDGGYPSFWNVDSAISIDVVGMKSYMDSLFDLMCESGRSRYINLTLLQIGICPVSLACFSMRERVKEHDRDIRFAPKRNMPRFVSVLRNRRGLGTCHFKARTVLMGSAYVPKTSSQLIQDSSLIKVRETGV